MIDRLVVGDGPLVRTVVGSLADQPGTVRAVTVNDPLAASLREQGTSVSTDDPTAPSTYADAADIDIVVTLAETSARNLAIARAVREAFSDVYLIAYAGDDMADNESVGAGLDAIADKCIDPVGAVASSLLGRAGDAGRQSRTLWGVLGDIDRLAVLAHDNPDPDAIASGIALARLADAAGCGADVCYFGDITHQENRAFVNVLDLPMRNLDAASDIEGYDGLALVDHSQPGVNNQIPPETPVDVVIDHHPPRSPVDAQFVDLKSSAGATSTLLVPYLEQFGLLDDETIATALLFGIHVDTDGFTRGVSQQDFQAAGTLLPHAALGMIERIESPSIASRTLETIALAIQNRQVEGEILLTCVGRLSDRDALAQAADQLLMLEDISTTVVYGFDADTIYVSARGRGTQMDLGETLRDAFDRIGSAGGHVDMAGAQIRLGVLDTDGEDDQSLANVVEEIVTNRFFEAVGPRVTDATDGAYGPRQTGECPESGTLDRSTLSGTEADDGTVLYTDRDDRASVAGSRDDPDSDGTDNE
jgi:nanoRNase/pAp phosphatase (c-di-AMP/oligoRNAs hydrolase)